MRQDAGGSGLKSQTSSRLKVVQVPWMLLNSVVVSGEVGGTGVGHHGGGPVGDDAATAGGVLKWTADGATASLKHEGPGGEDGAVKCFLFGSPRSCHAPICASRGAGARIRLARLSEAAMNRTGTLLVC